jgi:putative endonuclease
MADQRRDLGDRGERAAEEFLRRQRYTIVARNYQCPVGEIDLVALDGSTIVFVEVKVRTHGAAGSPLEAVGPRKQRQIARVARYYLSTHRLHDRDARFDVVGISWENDAPRLELVRNAFDAPA